VSAAAVLASPRAIAETMGLRVESTSIATWMTGRSSCGERLSASTVSNGSIGIRMPFAS